MDQSKLDYYVVALIGFLTGVFIVPTAYGVGLENKLILMALPLIIPFVFVFGLWFGNFLGKKFAVFKQFSRFVAVGFLNTAIDFGILNILSALTGITSGLRVGGVNVPGFVIAVLNSYFWNKLWVFKDRDKNEGLFGDFPKFLTVTVIGMLINSGVVVLITTYTPPLFGVPETIWLNASKLAAAVISLVWNFLGFKLIVFKK